ncbi:hypothetical protein BCIN_08g04910 [Botrytis cinerea B05.10]|uniref:NmrA-like domain-containing protein n=2 Tax=Botryotinia fuckeliana TaxID=40559 RepID=A0A384JQL0_BOTFB|nr:hypothetical protein BCIN_08g04910 [Botrytis cinerea B05.10]ATZ52869.1 hypothetical protein BCIN_08g04910 [Botrytis cinerea B05.10]EMR85605.1 putative oxidoreductase - protein [Botrytis cinerea BcDW1]
MSVIKNVAIAGSNGALGKPILEALLQSNKFNITILTRSSSTSTSTYPSSATVLPVDFNSTQSLTDALQSQKIDAIVSCVGTEGLLGQKLLIDAAVAAGVTRFIPSEFGSDLADPPTKALPVFGHKVATSSHLEAVAAKNPSFTYTYIRNGGFLDWGLEHNFILDVTSGKPSIYNGGDKLFSATTLATVAQAVVAVLSKFEETKNRAVYIQDVQTSQNSLLSIAKKVAPEKNWEAIPVKTADVLKSSNEKLAKGEITMEVMVGYIFVAIFGEEHRSSWEKSDNELLGLKEKTDAELEAIVKKYVK